MATKEQLMGLGMPVFLAGKIGQTPSSVAAAGTTFGTATSVGGDNYNLFCNSGTGGVVLKSPASADGYNIGDEIKFTNYTSAAVALYTRNALIIFSAVSVSGSVGFSVQPGQTFTMMPITASTWALLTIPATSVTAA